MPKISFDKKQEIKSIINRAVKQIYDILDEELPDHKTYIEDEQALIRTVADYLINAGESGITLGELKKLKLISSRKFSAWVKKNYKNVGFLLFSLGFDLKILTKDRNTKRLVAIKR